VSAGWRLRISHVTEVRYSGPVSTSFNEARMTPRTLPGQTALEARVSVAAHRGSRVPVWTYGDYWGTRVTVFELPEAHDDLLITATATVETSAPSARTGEGSRQGPSAGPSQRPRQGRPDWDEIRRTAARTRLLEYILPTPLTTLPPEAIRAAIGPGIPGSGATIGSGMTPEEAAQAIAARVRERVAYVPGATGVRTDAREAWAKGQGVCQDIAHVTVSLLRAAGLPARYVSGYLHPRVSPEPGTTAAGQTHAWVEYWAGGWAPLDPTHGVPVGERHIVVARGRDYADVPPLKGIYHGAAGSTMTATVEVTRLA
jgi:transglutaminase-like putative cysteine protease